MATPNSESGRGFDAVAESRRWKEAVAAATAGMTTRQRMAWFRAHSSVDAIRKGAKIKDTTAVVHEEPPEYGQKEI